MKLTRNDSTGVYTLESENRTIDFTANEMSFLFNQYSKINLRDSIEYELHEADGDTIDLERYPYTFEELVDEIFTDLEDEIDYGNPVSDDDIKEKITDTADFYEMCIE